MFGFLMGINFNSENRLIRSDIILNDDIQIIRDIDGRRLSMLKIGDVYYLPISEQGLYLGYNVDLCEKEDKVEVNLKAVGLQEEPIQLDIDTIDIDGIRFTNEDIYSKNYTIFVNWASWCNDCKRFFKEYKEVKQEFEDNNINVIGVPIFDKSNENTYSLGIERVRETMIEFGLNDFKNIIVDKGLENQLQTNMQNIPCFVVVDKKGRIVMIEESEDIVLKDLIESVKGLETCGEC